MSDGVSSGLDPLTSSGADKTFTIVTTTINVPRLLDDYAIDSLRFDRRVDFIVIGDRKTPPETAGFCADLENRLSVRCLYMSPEDQTAYLASRAEFDAFLPWDCIQRRNVGLIKAYENGSDVVVTIDDDNLIAAPDYLSSHAHLGDRTELEAVRSQSGWWNVCEMLEEAHGVRIYHRGHPFSKRWQGEEEYRSSSRIAARAVVNAGLWLDDPDVDAVARLAMPICVTGPSAAFRSRVACDVGTWAPFNSQNTALLREVIPAYFLFPYVGRYDDIWASYVVRRIADHMGDVVTYGAPLVRQKRNAHNYFRDLDAERMGMEYTDAFLSALGAIAISSNSYSEGFAEIAQAFPEAIARECVDRKLDPAPLEPVSKGFSLWTTVFG